MMRRETPPPPKSSWLGVPDVVRSMKIPCGLALSWRSTPSVPMLWTAVVSSPVVSGVMMDVPASIPM